MCVECMHWSLLYKYSVFITQSFKRQQSQQMKSMETMASGFVTSPIVSLLAGGAVLFVGRLPALAFFDASFGTLRVE